jgi:hypothetical protein
LAERWKRTARSVQLADPDDALEESARGFLVQEAALAKHGAEAITINCLGGFYSGFLTAYPCLNGLARSWEGETSAQPWNVRNLGSAGVSPPGTALRPRKVVEMASKANGGDQRPTAAAALPMTAVGIAGR